MLRNIITIYFCLDMGKVLCYTQAVLGRKKMKEIDVELEIDEDEVDDVNVHLYCNGVTAMLLHDEELDKMSLEKLAIEKLYDKQLDQEIDYEETRMMVKGGVIGVAAMTALGMCANMFQDLLINAGWLTIAGVVGLIGFHNSRQIKNNNALLNALQEKFTEAQNAYDKKVEEVAMKNVEAEKNVENIYA